MSDKPIAAGKSSFDLVDGRKVFEALDLCPETILLDLACGVGKYSIAAAEFVGRSGAIHAVDLWQEGIAALRFEAEERGLSQIHPLVADVGRRLPLAEGSFDIALMATVLHDLVQAGAADAALEEAVRLLKPGGRLAVIEFDKVESRPGPPLAIRLAPHEVEELVSAHGLRRERMTRVGPHHYLLSFVRPVAG